MISAMLFINKSLNLISYLKQALKKPDNVNYPALWNISFV